ncbi:hypothetical protein YC2023_043648 [Brassica napus]
MRVRLTRSRATGVQARSTGKEQLRQSAVGWWRVSYSSAWRLVGEASCRPSQVAYGVFLHSSARLKVAAPSCVGSSALSQARAYLFLGAGVESSMAPAESELQQLPPCLLRSRHLFSCAQVESFSRRFIAGLETWLMWSVLWFSKTEQGKAFIASIWSLVLVESWWLLVWNRNIPGLELSTRCSGRCVSSCNVAGFGFLQGDLAWFVSLSVVGFRWVRAKDKFRQSLLGSCRELP